jgi:cytochrome P450
MTLSEKLLAALAAHNPFDHTQMVDPYPLYAEARRATPIFFNPPTNTWMVTRPDEITAVLRDPARFTSKYVMSPRTTPPPEVIAVLEGHDTWLPTLLTTDPPDHTRLRSLLTKGLSAQRTARMEPQLLALADELIDGFVADGRGDLMARFTFPFTAMVIGDLLGMPREDIPTLKRWSDDWIRLLWNAVPLDQLIASARGLIDFQRYFAEIVAERRKSPGDDLLSALIQVHLDDDSRLDEKELIAVPMQLIMAGHETTFYLIGNALALLLERPALVDAVRARPALIPNIVEETLRLNGPIFWLSRQTTTEVELGGVTLPKETNVTLLISAANHDERMFPDPTQFEAERSNAERNFSLGLGPHFCLGAALARLESRIALERLLTRLPNLKIEPGKPLQRAKVIAFHGFEHLHALWDAPTTTK